MASGFTLEIVINRNILPSIAGEFGRAADLGLDAWAAETLQECKSNAPVATGGLRASGYRITPVTNTYGEAASAFVAANPKGSAAPPGPTGDHEAVVGFCADYALFVNNGHATRSGGFVVANPFFTSGVLAKQDKLSEHVAHYVDALCRTGHAA